MLESHSQPASVGSESEIETGPATQSITILGLRFNVQSPYSAGHVCTKGEARALNQKRLESIRNHLAKNGALTQADVDAYAASYVFGERTTRRRPVEAEALALARRLVRKKGQSTKENTEAARELLQSEKGDAIRAQAAKRVAELKDLMVA
jgi:adenine-specific DNA methylase